MGHQPNQQRLLTIFTSLQDIISTLIDAYDKTIEVAIAAGLGFLILYLHRRAEHKMEEFVEKVHEMILEEYTLWEQKRYHWGNEMINIFNEIARLYGEFKRCVGVYLTTMPETSSSCILEYVGKIANALDGPAGKLSLKTIFSNISSQMSPDMADDLNKTIESFCFSLWEIRDNT